MRTANIKPTVSVCVVTYNQEGYIAECLQRLVDQETDFEFEVIVADDCSTDGTRGIITEFAQRYPATIKPIFHEKNIGAYKNFVFVHAQAGGKYIAHMDGDDYALPGKLQAQVEFLERNPECNIVWHRMYLLNERTGALVPDSIDFSVLRANRFDRGDILRYITVGMNSSKMYRASVRDFPLPDFPVIDYFANVEQVGSGFAAFVGTEPLGIYRTGIGIASSGNTTKILLRDAFLYFVRRYPRNCSDVCVAALVLMSAAIKNRKWPNALLFGAVVLRTFRVGVVGKIMRDRNVFRLFRFPLLAR